MAIYTVHKPPLADPQEAALNTVFIKEGIAFAAIVFPFLWFLFHRLWLVLLGYVAVLALLEGLALVAGVAVAGVVMTLLSILIGLEANSLRRWTLTRRGWVLADVVAGRSMDECVHRYYLAEQNRSAGDSQAKSGQDLPPTRPVPDVASDDVLGVFPSKES